MDSFNSREQENIISQLDFSDWDYGRLGFPHKYIIDYYPKDEYPPNYCDSFYVVLSTDLGRSAIWNFKDAKHCYTYPKGKKVYQRLEEAKKLQSILYDMFSFRFIDKLTLVCVPASTKAKYEKRFRDFSIDFCSDLGFRLDNAFEHIHYDRDGSPFHLGEGEPPLVHFTPGYFEGRLVILFDDLVTTGRTIKNMKNLLEQNGARVICAISLGRTVFGDRVKIESTKTQEPVSEPKKDDDVKIDFDDFDDTVTWF